MLSKINELDAVDRIRYLLYLVGAAVIVMNTIVGVVVGTEMAWTAVGISIGAIIGSMIVPAVNRGRPVVKRWVRERHSINPTAQISPRVTISTQVLTVKSRVCNGDGTPKDGYQMVEEVPRRLKPHLDEMDVKPDIHCLRWEVYDTHAVECSREGCNGLLDIPRKQGVTSGEYECQTCYRDRDVVTVTRLTVRK